MLWLLKNGEQTCCKKTWPLIFQSSISIRVGHHNQLSVSPKDRWTEPVVVWISNSTHTYTYIYNYIYIHNTFNITWLSWFNIQYLQSSFIHEWITITSLRCHEQWLLKTMSFFFHGLIPEITGRCVAFLQADEWPKLSIHIRKYTYILYIYSICIMSLCI